MILFGHPLLLSERFYHIESLEAIVKTPSNSIIALFFAPQNIDLIVHLHNNKIRFALYVASTTEAVLAENMKANYLIVHPKVAQEIQKVADHYMFDAKVLGYIDQENQLEKLIDMRLDGAVFIEAIVKITS
ncbi:MAG: hypothetical protein PHV62_02880 [Sulfuricurvum sp.]|nr:hypothetical protein [Sulfuricurvum sp.]